MKKILIIAAVLLPALVSCFELDVLVAPMVFRPVPAEEYQLGGYSGADFYTELQAVYPDDTIDILLKVSFKSGDNQDLNLYGMHLIHNDLGVTGRTIIYCHGNYYNIDIFWTRVKLLFNTGCNVFIFDYRGYGKSDGEITEAGWYQDAANAFQYVLSQGVALKDLTLYGFSLGSTAAVYIASELDPQAQINGLILEAPVGSTDVYIQDAVLLPLPAEYVTGFELDNISRIQNVAIRLFWIHGTTDHEPIYHATHGDTVFTNHPGQENIDKFKLIVAGGDHGDLPKLIGFDAYIQKMKNFIEGSGEFGS